MLDSVTKYPATLLWFFSVSWQKPVGFCFGLVLSTACVSAFAVDTLTVDGRSVSYWPSAEGGPFAEFQFDTQGYRNIYTLDCKKRQFLWKMNRRISTGEVTSSTKGAEWRSLNPKSTISNAVYEAICPQLLVGDTSAPELSFHTPQKGSPERKAIMDAVRAGYSNKKVLFRVHYLMVSSDWAWTRVTGTLDGKLAYESSSYLVQKIEGSWKVSGSLDHAGDCDEVCIEEAYKELISRYPAAPRGIFENAPDLSDVDVDVAAQNAKGEIVDQLVPVTPNLRALVRDILDAYDNDLKTINLVADFADYAALAWAAYDEPEAIRLANSRGWNVVRHFSNKNLLEGDTTATLFVSDRGKHVLAFRGTDKLLSDGASNVGTLLPGPLTNRQVAGAREIADEVIAGHGDVIFVGHSLGGRLAQVARFQTGNVAVKFNSAPIGLDDAIFASFGLSDTKAALYGFRSRHDALTAAVPVGDTVVRNILPADGAILKERLGRVKFDHSMKVLAQAMQEVRLARDEGWIAAVQNEAQEKSSSVWILKSEPDIEIETDSERDGFVLNEDGSATFAGKSLFAAWESSKASAFRLFVYRSPDAKSAIIAFLEPDLSLKRIGVVDLESSLVVTSSIKPRSTWNFSNGKIAWSPSNDYAAVGFPTGGMNSKLAVINVKTAKMLLYGPADLADDDWASPSLETVKSIAPGQIEVAFSLFRCPDGKCTYLGSPTETFTIDGVGTALPKDEIVAESATCFDADCDTAGQNSLTMAGDVAGAETEIFVISTPQGVLKEEQTLEAGGCKHYTQVPADSIQWMGRCSGDGFLSGAGEMTYIRDDLVILIVKAGPNSDVELIDGRMVWARRPPYSIERVEPEIHSSIPTLKVIVTGAGGSNLHLMESIQRVATVVRTDEKTIDAMNNASEPIARLLILVYKDERGNFERFMVDAQSGEIHEFHNNESARMNNRLRALNRDVLAQDQREAKERQKVEIAELRATAEKEWPERWDAFMTSTESWPNTADQLRHDLSAAVLSLKKGRPIILEAEEIGFADNSAVITTYQSYTNIYEGIPEGNFTWEKWFDKTQSASSQRGYRITCRMEPDALAIVKKGHKYVVDARLTTLQGEHVSLTCSNPRSP